jgi:hypothetical protein
LDGFFEPTEQELQAYAGIYYSPELDAWYLLKVDPEDALSVRVGSDDPVLAEPRIRDVFCMPSGAELRFHRDADRRVDGFTLNARGVRGVRLVRKG